jgi:hypothetical protein
MASEASSPQQVELLSDLLLCRLKATYESLLEEPEALKVVSFWVALPIATRSPTPIAELRKVYGLEVKSAEKDDLLEALESIAPTDSKVKAATRTTLQSVADDPILLDGDAWSKWRAYDGPEFCNLAYRFYSDLNSQYFRAELPSISPDALEILAKEMAVITKAFSARWFNACARLQTPSRNSIRWYLAHCLGKLDLELSREMSDWVETPRKRKGEPEPCLDL